MQILDEISVICVKGEDGAERVHIRTVIDEDGDMPAKGLTIPEVEQLILNLQTAISEIAS